MSENFENKIDETPAAETPVVEEPKVEEPKVETSKFGMPKPENVVSSASIRQDVPLINTKPDMSGQVAVYALRSLTLPSGTIPAGYSYISQAKYDQVSSHKAIRKASADEVKTYLK